jgi:sigma-B regulation protein RsbU (phosphoserine phosphatase)
MAITHAIAHAQPGAHTPPAQLLTYLNDQLVRSYTRGGTFVTAFYAVLDPKTRTLTYSSAGHNPPRLLRASNERVVALDKDGALPLGIDTDQHYGQSTITLDRGDLLLLYTDGITEAMAPVKDGSRELFGVERLDHLLMSFCKTGTDECLAQIRRVVGEFTANASPIDDQTLLAIRCT